MNAYVIMRNDVEIGYTTDEPIFVLLENTYESRYKAMKYHFWCRAMGKGFCKEWALVIKRRMHNIFYCSC